ncbi:3'(2'),5'-bisphosphate nucleotidase [Polyrhizophydium stewartii]|uniref:3'(2'),5'-bisphosphate nucleotidase n=1 Tax=Polyrhizophydium stewartii TaxID=2732419 RepID=A0ABR4NEV4_9FUNG
MTASSALPLSRERAVGIEAVLRASRLCQAVFARLAQAQTVTKADLSPVTVADYGAQAVVNALLHAEFPSDPIVGEEDAADLRADARLAASVVELTNSVQPAGAAAMSSDDVLAAIDLGQYAGGKTGRFWTLDPIDGTKGFLRGEQYAVCLALVVDGVVQLAVQGCPNLPHDLAHPEEGRGSLFIAVRGQGAFERHFDSADERRISVSGVSSASETQFCESVEAAHSSQSDTAQIADRLGITRPPVRMDSQCKYAVIARGDAGIYLRVPTRADYQEKIWDHAGGSLLVEEAGGSICDVTGKPLDFSLGRTLKGNKGIIATNGRIHARVVEAVRSVLRL